MGDDGGVHSPHERNIDMNFEKNSLAHRLVCNLVSTSRSGAVGARATYFAPADNGRAEAQIALRNGTYVLVADEVGGSAFAWVAPVRGMAPVTLYSDSGEDLKRLTAMVRDAHKREVVL